MKRVLLAVVAVFLLISCSSENPFKLKDTSEIGGIHKYLKEELNFEKTDFDEGSISLIYLILSECNCVYDNIEFVKDFLVKNDKRLILVVKPDKSEKYVEEMKFLSSQVSSKFKLIVDYDNDFMKYGNYYITDKYFVVNDDENILKLELKKNNFEQIKNISGTR